MAKKHEIKIPYDHDIAMWALRVFPKIVKQKTVTSWKRKDNMPYWLYKEDIVRVYGIPLTLACKLKNVTQKKFCSDCGFNYIDATNNWFVDNPEKRKIIKESVRKKIEEYFSDIMRKVNKIQSKPRVVKEMYVVEYDTSNEIVSYNIMKTIYETISASDTQNISGKYVRNKFKGLKINDLSDLFVEMTHSQMSNVIKQYSPILKHFLI